MIATSDLSLYLVATFIMAFTPGNDVLFVASHSLGRGWQDGVFAALGVSFGIIIHITALALGLSELLVKFPWVLTTIKLLGACYLLYLAFKAFRTMTPLPLKMHLAGKYTVCYSHPGKVFMRGITNNVLNPKVALFFLAFIPQFINPAGSSLPLQIILLGGCFFIVGLTANLFYAVLFCFASNSLKKNSFFQKWANKISGIVFCGLAFKMLLTH